MQIEKRQKVLLIVLAVVVVFAIGDFVINSDDYSSFYGSDSKTAVEKSAKPKTAAARVASARVTPPSAKSWGRDPFDDPSHKPAPRRIVKKAPRVSLTLKAISYAGQASMAMINDQVLSVGDEIAGYRIVKIEQSRVLLSKGDENLTLKL